MLGCDQALTTVVLHTIADRLTLVVFVDGCERQLSERIGGPPTSLFPSDLGLA